MLKCFCRFLTGFLLSLNPLFVLGGDIKGSADHALFQRAPGTAIIAYDRRSYDQIFVPTEAAFRSGNWHAGGMTWIVYQAPLKSTPGYLYQYYSQAMADAGFEVAFSCEEKNCGDNFIRTALTVTGRTVGLYETWTPGTSRYIAGKLGEGDQTTWVSILVHQAGGRAYIRQEIVEPAVARPLTELAARNIGERSHENFEIKLPAGKVANGGLSSLLTQRGQVTWKAYRLGRDASPVELYSSYRAHLIGEGYETTFTCGRSGCGTGFVERAVNLNGFIADGSETWKNGSGFYLLAERNTPAKREYFSMLSYLQPNGLAVARQMKVVVDEGDVVALESGAQEAVADQTDVIQFTSLEQEKKAMGLEMNRALKLEGTLASLRGTAAYQSTKVEIQQIRQQLEEQGMRLAGNDKSKYKEIMKEVVLRYVAADDPMITAQRDKQRLTLTITRLRNLESKVQLHILDHGKPPAVLSAILGTAGEWDLLDGWGNPFTYSVQSNGAYKIRSLGADGLESTDDVLSKD